MNALARSTAARTIAEEIDAIAGDDGRDLTGAAATLRELADRSRALGLHSLEARASYASARYLVQLGDVDEALLSIDRAQLAFLAAGEPIDALRTGLGRMHALHIVGRHAANVAAAEAMLDELATIEESGDVDAAQCSWLRAAVTGNLGAALGSLGDHARAIEAHLGSAEAFDRVDAPVDAALGRANAGLERLALGDARGAHDLLGAALGVLRAAADPVFEAKCAAALGQALIGLGELHEAMVVLDDAQLRLHRLRAGQGRRQGHREGYAQARR